MAASPATKTTAKPTTATEAGLARNAGAKPPQLKLERTFDASPERLWEHWTDPAKYAKWLNPGRHDLRILKWDLRVGGECQFVMPLDDGTERPDGGVFWVLDKPRRLVSGSPDRSFQIDVTFTPLDGGKRTRMDVVVDGVPADWHAMASEGWGRSLAKLAGLVEAKAGTSGAPGVKGISAPAKGHVSADRVVHLERWFKASPERVFKAWSDPAMLPKFFWPVGEGKVESLDFRAGGQLRMGHAQFADWKAIWTFVEIVPNTRIVTRDIWPDGSGLEATGTLEFTAKDGGCLMTVRHGPFPKTGPYQPEGAVAGFKMVADRLAEEVEMPAQGEGFRLVRYLNAPTSKVYQMWTTKEGLAKWWGPSANAMGYQFKVNALDVKPGGRYDVVMANKEHGELHNHGRYVEVVPNKRIVQEWQFDIFLGPGETPYPISITVELEEVPTMEPGKMGTKLTFTQGPMAKPEFTEGSRQGVIQNLGHLAKAVEA
jgi:uncharacterized protein YndB with AHSA1/START domain